MLSLASRLQESIKTPKVLPQSRRAQVTANQAVPHIAEAVVLLISIRPIDSPRAVVPLARHGTNVSIDFLGLLASLLVHVEASNVSCKLSLDYGDSHLSPDGDADLRGAGSNACLLHALRQPVVSPNLAILPPEVRGYHGVRSGLAKEDLAERNHPGEVV